MRSVFGNLDRRRHIRIDLIREEIVKLANRIKVFKQREARLDDNPTMVAVQSSGTDRNQPRLDRFLTLGVEGPTLFVGCNAYRSEELPALMAAIESDGPDVVRRVVERSREASCPSALVFALAMASANGDESTRKAALQAIPTVCSCGTELLAFVSSASSERGWGRGLRNAIGDWYAHADPANLASESDLIVEGWTHRDALRLAHPKPRSDEQREVFQAIARSTPPSRLDHSGSLTTTALDEAMARWQPTGKRILVAVDATKSMRAWNVAGSKMTAAEAASRVALGICAREPLAALVGWGASIQPVTLSRRPTVPLLRRAIETNDVRNGSTSSPIAYAMAKKRPIDAFVVLTDNETTVGAVPPAKALAAYRERMEIDAKLLFVALSSTGFHIADPDDLGMLDVAGFDASTPRAIRAFVDA